MSLRHPLAAGLGAVGGATLGGAGLVQVDPWLGLASALVAGGAGYYIGNNHDRLAYALKARLRLHENRQNQDRAEQKAPKTPAFRALSQKDCLNVRATATSPRRYDGFDSSRDIAALYAREGESDEPYAIEIEMAHLRPAAENGHLDTKVTLSWPGLDPESPLEMLVDNNLPLPGLLVHHSPTFQRVQLRLDKDCLRSAGWTDGQPLQILAQTLDPQGQPATELAGQSDQRCSPGSIFRWEGKTVYSAVTDRFYNGDPSNDYNCQPDDLQRFHGGDWQGLIEKLDYLQSLNVDCLWISCPYLALRDHYQCDGFHGYWPIDFEKTEPNFGSRDTLRRLTQQAHDRGIKVMLDVVLNHTGYDHPFTQDPQKKDWFHNYGNIGALSQLNQWELENFSLCYLPDLAQENPKVSRYLIEVHQDWLQDADAFRMDALRHMPESFLREFDQAMREKKPNFYSVGEAFCLEADPVANYQNHSNDAMFDFPLAYAIRRVFAGDPSRDLPERLRLYEIVKKHASQVEAWRVLLDSHQSQPMSTLSEVFKNDRLYDNPGKLATFVDNHDMVRFMSDTGGDRARLEQALAFLYAARGTPYIYYGTEVAMEGIGPANRKDMEWDKDPEMTDFFRQLSQVRRDSPALQYGSQQELHCASQTYGFTRMRPDEEVICLFNRSQKERSLKISLHPESQIPDQARLHDLLAEGEVVVEQRAIEVSVPPQGYRFLQWKDL